MSDFPQMSNLTEIDKKHTQFLNTSTDEVMNTEIANQNFNTHLSGFLT